jgi:RNA polymerase sigma factor (sigma-70 family)
MPSDLDLEIRSLIHACLENDGQSWNKLLQNCTAIATGFHKEHYSSLSSFDTDNILSNVIKKLFGGGLSKFRGESKYEFLGYLRTIIRNETFSYIRANSRQDKTLSLDQPYRNVEDQPLKDIIYEKKLGPDAIHEINDLFQRAMEHLSVRDGQILLFKAEGYKDKEISELMGIPMNTVASRYSRIKELLVKVLLFAFAIIFSGRNYPWGTSL